MTIQDVAEASAVNLEAQCFDPDDRFVDPYDVLELCSSLVSLVDLDPDFSWAAQRKREWIPGAQAIQFAHFSVKEFVLSERTQSMIPQSLRIDSTTSQHSIEELCLLYILDFNGGKRARFVDCKLPMIAYAILHWRTHMKAVSPENLGT
jgi:hypothetical protein